MAKNGYSRKGFFGETIHYDANGRKVGETRKNFWGGYDHYDANGHKVGESTRNFWGGTNYYSNSASSGRSSFGGSSFDDDNDAIQDEVDCFDNPDEAAAWLEDEGYDPSDFDL